MSRDLTKDEVYQAKADLEADGWKHQKTVGKGPGNHVNFGLLFTKADNAFWLNKETYDRRPSKPA